MSIPSFRRKSAPRLGAKDGERVRSRERWRGTRQERGYDTDWEKLRASYFKEGKGICEECRRRGYHAQADVVDHIIPVRDAPDKRLDRNNLQNLCRQHHAWKYKLEEYARKTGAVRLLPQWCRFPETRPRQFQIVKFGPLVGMFASDIKE